MTEANGGVHGVASSAGDVLAGLAAVCLVGAVAEAAPHVRSIDAGVARLYHAGSLAGGMPVAGERARELDRAQHTVPTATAILSVGLTINGSEGVAYGLADGTLILLSP